MHLWPFPQDGRPPPPLVTPANYGQCWPLLVAFTQLVNIYKYYRCPALANTCRDDGKYSPRGPYTSPVNKFTVFRFAWPVEQSGRSPCCRVGTNAKFNANIVGGPLTCVKYSHKTSTELRTELNNNCIVFWVQINPSRVMFRFSILLIFFFLLCDILFYSPLNYVSKSQSVSVIAQATNSQSIVANVYFFSLLIIRQY